MRREELSYEGKEKEKVSTIQKDFACRFLIFA
jgi:hypothetical protein